MQTPEKKLLDRIKKSNKTAFKDLYYIHYPVLFRYVVYRIGDREIAEDIVQETFVRIWNNRSRLDSNKSFFSLIARISSNLCYDHFRHQKVKIQHQEKLPELYSKNKKNPESGHDLNEMKEAIWNAVNDHLPDKCRKIFLLSRNERKTNQEIADLLNISKRTVENQLYRALKILRKLLKNYL